MIGPTGPSAGTAHAATYPPAPLMSASRKITAVAAIAAVAGLSFTAIGIISHDPARATPVFNVQQGGPMITITNEGLTYRYSPAQLDARVGQPITVTNNDPYGVHSVTEKMDRSFSVDVPPESSVTLTVSKPGNYTYFCLYHTDSHDPPSGSLNVS
jgi:plastocyanin